MYLFGGTQFHRDGAPCNTHCAPDRRVLRRERLPLLPRSSQILYRQEPMDTHLFPQLSWPKVCPCHGGVSRRWWEALALWRSVSCEIFQVAETKHSPCQVSLRLRTRPHSFTIETYGLSTLRLRLGNASTREFVPRRVQVIEWLSTRSDHSPPNTMIKLTMHHHRLASLSCLADSMIRVVSRLNKLT